MGNRRNYITDEIVKYSRKLDAKGFVANHDGNISAKLDDVLLATPTAVSKGNMTHEMVITLDSVGKKIEGIGQPFSEIKLHLAAYEVRSEAKAVIHAHSPLSTAFGLVHDRLLIQIPEAVVSLGFEIPVTPFCMPGAAEQADLVSDALSRADIFMMPGNGVFAIGDNVEQAYLRIELLEHVIKIQQEAARMGVMMELSAADRQLLLDKRASLGLGPAIQSDSQPVVAPNTLSDQIKQIIQAELARIS